MFVYADNAATTKMSKTAIDAMLPYLDTWYGNASSLYEFGQKSAEALAAARETVAGCLGAEAREITFTSGGSEADNQAIISAARNGARKGKKHLISTKFEHHAVLHTLDKLRKEGFDVTLLDVHENGVVRVEDALRLAEEADLDLVEVAPDARPPVCKLMDYGKFKYESAMKARDARRNQANTQLKEIQFRPKIDEQDRKSVV